MESRKYQLQKQIIEALKSDDDDLYTILKSQWAHRFGVESLEELNNLDLQKSNQNSTNLDNQNLDTSQENLIEGDKPISIKNFDNQEKETKTSVMDLIKDDNNNSLKTKSSQIVNKDIYEDKAITSTKENKRQTKIQTLIPLPPKPRYGYLKKWLLRK